MTLDATEQLRYSRHLLLPEIGAAGQEQLRAARVLIVGAGGLGSPAALYLAAAGVGTLGLVDHDRVDLSNLQRQILFSTAGVGAAKVTAARERLLALNPGIDVQAHDLELRAANAAALLSAYDIVIDGSDRLGTRYLVNDACVLLGKPLVSAAIHRFEGQAMTYVPGQGPCYRCLFSDSSEGVVPNCAEAGVLGVLPGVMGGIQATEVIKLITGAGTPLIGRLLTYDALDMRFREFRFARRADCAVCGEAPTITTLQETAAACASDDIAGLVLYTPAALRARLRDSGSAQPVLVDVREAHEFAAGHLPDSIHLPLPEMVARCGELPQDRELVFICRSGARSRRACQIAAAGGHTRLGNLEGGLAAWQATETTTS
jgi:sulfur-carrier protein adenylyltransferase/sulfurtransferase